MKLSVAMILLSVFVLGGCTKSIVASYNPGIELENNAISGKSIAIHKFDDERSWIDKKDAKSNSFIGKQGSWKFGMKYENVEFTPVAAVLQDVMIKEFSGLGVKAFKGDESAEPAYALKGKILNFEFENETGMWTVTSRRHVSLALTLLDPNGKALMANELFNEVDRENEGMGVMHSTNVDKLMKDALKKVVVNVVSRTNTELAMLGVDELTVTLNGVAVPYRELQHLYAMSSN